MDVFSVALVMAVFSVVSISVTLALVAVGRLQA